ncbi:hypothetical protein Mapa_000714 [Marchantia paleacea]|nr:hypothetical protein Mapa_000714 [Marchantia paleacea]
MEVASSSITMFEDNFENQMILELEMKEIQDCRLDPEEEEGQERDHDDDDLESHRTSIILEDEFERGRGENPEMRLSVDPEGRTQDSDTLIRASWSAHDPEDMPQEIFALSANLFQEGCSAERRPSANSEKEYNACMLVDPEEIQQLLATSVNVVQDLLESWNPDLEKDVEDRLMEELELVTELDLEISNMSNDRVGALGRALQQRPLPKLETLKLFSIRSGLGDPNQGKAMMEIFKAIEMGNLSNLRVMELFNTSVGAAAAKALAAAISAGHSSTLQILKVLDNIGDLGLIELSAALEAGHAPSLKTLGLGFYAHVSRARTKGLHIFQGAEALGRVFQSGKIPLLEHLELWGIVEQEAVIAIFKALESAVISKGFKSLKLYECVVGLGGARAIARALVSSKFATLTKLDLSSCKSMRDDGLSELFRAFKSKNLNSLQELAMDNVSMGEKGLLEMAVLMEAGHLPTLLRLSMEGQDSGHISEACAEALVRAYRNNHFLYATIKVRWASESMRNNAEGFRWRNVRLRKRSLKLLRSEPDVAANHAKVFLCGPPKVGKTTLRKSLCRTHWESLTSSERNRAEERTRGIEVSEIAHKNLVLGVWDLAGQPEYHLLHSAFLPDLALGEGQATIFVIVCSANYSGKKDIAKAKKEIDYWMRFISSSSDAGGSPDSKRHVFVVLNSFEGDHSCHSMDDWTNILSVYGKKFDKCVYLHSEPFIINAMFRKEVRNFKKQLVKMAEDLLQKRKMPKICMELQKWIAQWLKGHSQYPVLEWKEYFSTLAGGVFPQHKLRLATEYLHEAGQLIYFREGALQEAGLAHESYVILDTDWFCRSIVGNVLLPDAMLRPGETSLRLQMRADGSVSLAALQAYLPRQLNDELQVQEVVAMVLRLGLAYKIGEDDIFIPALMETDEIPSYWELRIPDQWVMGFALAVADSETSLLPITIFRQLQVELARNLDFGGRSDSHFAAGRNLITFKHKGMAVMVQYDADPTNRLDVLVRPLLRVANRRGQVNLAHALVKIMVQISGRCCPGVRLEWRVVEPWNAEEGLKAMEQRNVRTSVAEVKCWVKRDGIGQPTSMVVQNEVIFGDMLLSDNDLLEIRRSVELEKDLM